MNNPTNLFNTSNNNNSNQQNSFFNSSSSILNKNNTANNISQPHFNFSVSTSNSQPQLNPTVASSNSLFSSNPNNQQQQFTSNPSNALFNNTNSTLTQPTTNTLFSSTNNNINTDNNRTIEFTNNNNNVPNNALNFNNYNDTLEIKNKTLEESKNRFLEELELKDEYEVSMELSVLMKQIIDEYEKMTSEYLKKLDQQVLEKHLKLKQLKNDLEHVIIAKNRYMQNMNAAWNLKAQKAKQIMLNVESKLDEILKEQGVELDLNEMNIKLAEINNNPNSNNNNFIVEDENTMQKLIVDIVDNDLEMRQTIDENNLVTNAVKDNQEVIMIHEMFVGQIVTLLKMIEEYKCMDLKENNPSNISIEDINNSRR